MIKKILSVLITACLLISLFGCAKCINTEYQDVEVKIVNVHRRGVRRVGSVLRPAKYTVTVEYDNSNYVITGKETYNKYRNKVEQVTIGVLETHIYDDGTVKQRIVSLK